VNGNDFLVIIIAQSQGMMFLKLGGVKAFNGKSKSWSRGRVRTWSGDGNVVKCRGL